MFKRARLLSYDAASRTAQVHVFGLTDGASNGLTATFAYPVGDDDRDTERQIVVGNEVYVFFEADDEARPVIAFYSSHGKGAEIDVRRIRQKNIELLATARAYVEAPTIHLRGNVVIDGDITHNGNTVQQGNTVANGNHTVSGVVIGSRNVIGGGVSLNSHRHGNVRSGPDTSGGPV